MSGFVGEELKAQIRSANDIVEVVQWLNVPLKKAGGRYRALCPFHKEKTPSFNVSAQHQAFHCFGCGAAGDVFKFVMLREGLDFPTALRRLAERAHIPIPERAGGSPEPSRDLKDRLYALHLKARDWFHTNLMRAHQAAPAREYLKTRAFSAATAREFRLGYALAGWDSLIRWGQANGVEVSLLQEAGLVVMGEHRPYDRFRDRLMIPIADESGRVVGFSGRLLSQEAKEAKYVNSPETPIFKKGRLLFGLDQSKKHLLEEKAAVICEGQLDWIRCFESGIRNVIAPQGTAFTEDQARILKRYVEQVVLCFDSDAAGQKATWRNAEILIATGLAVRAVRMPAGEDPDSLIRGSGAAALRKLLETAVDVFEYKARALVVVLDMREPRNHQKVVSEMTPLLALVDNEPQRQQVIQNVCDILRTDVTAFLTEFQRQRRRLQKTVPAAVEAARESLAGEDVFQNELTGYGDYLLRLSLLEEPAARMLADQLQEAWFAGYGLRHALFHVIRRAGEGRWKPGWDGLDLGLDDADKERIGRLLTHPLVDMDERAMATGLQDMVAAVRRAYLKEEYQQRARLLRNPKLSEEERLRFQRELLDLGHKMKDA